MKQDSAGKRIIEGLKQALAFAKGDKTKGRLFTPRQCHYCHENFQAEALSNHIFCKKCDVNSHARIINLAREQIAKMERGS